MMTELANRMQSIADARPAAERARRKPLRPQIIATDVWVLIIPYCNSGA